MQKLGVTRVLERLTHARRTFNANPKCGRGKDRRKTPRLRFGLV